jgi:hypothetical protein
LAVWNGSTGSAAGYNVIGTGGANHWFTFLNAEGDVLGGNGAIYLADGGWSEPHPGLAEIRSAPEPSTVALLITGGLVLAAAWCWRRRRN